MVIISTASRSSKRHINLAGKEDSQTGCGVLGGGGKYILLADRTTLYRIVSDIIPITCDTLAVHLPELGCWNSKSLASPEGASLFRDGGKKPRQPRYRAMARPNVSINQAFSNCAIVVDNLSLLCYN